MSMSSSKEFHSLQSDADKYFGGNLYQLLISQQTKNYPDFLKLIDSTMLDAIAELENDKNIYKNFGEDALTASIISCFRMRGITAEHDANRGGHCDIVIEKNTFQWLCEAKDYESYSKLWDGYLQLTTRYSTGRENADHGGMLIYNKKEYAFDNIAEWQVRLTAKEIKPPITINDSNNRHFSSVQKHLSSGLDYTVKHYSVLLHHDPQDRKNKIAVTCNDKGEDALQKKVHFLGFPPEEQELLEALAEPYNLKVLKKQTKALYAIITNEELVKRQIEKATDNGTLIMDKQQFLDFLKTHKINKF